MASWTFRVRSTGKSKSNKMILSKSNNKKINLLKSFMEKEAGSKSVAKQKITIQIRLNHSGEQKTFGLEQRILAKHWDTKTNAPIDNIETELHNYRHTTTIET